VLYDGSATTLLFAHLPSVLVARLELTPGSQTLATFAELLRSESIGQRPGGKAILDVLMRVLLGYGLREYADQPPVQPNWLAALAEPRLGKVVQAVLQCPADAWMLDTMAARRDGPRHVRPSFHQWRGSDTWRVSHRGTHDAGLQTAARDLAYTH
jgi:AraC family transcriptional activator of mtrCDE